MKHHVLPSTLGPLCAGLVAMLVALLPATPARAQNRVSFIAVNGNDGASNTCSDPATPCQTFPKALLNTVPGGEIICVGAGSLVGGAVIISQSVTIDCAGTTGIAIGAIDINGAGIVVKLRNLTINPINFNLATNTYGIRGINMAALFVENCNVLGFTGNTPGIGIQFVPTSPGSQLVVTDTMVSNNGSGTTGGVS